MTISKSANHYTFENESGSIQITYDPSVLSSSTGGQHAGGPRLAYHGPEGDRVFPRPDSGPTHVAVQEDSPLGPLVSVILIPTIDARAVTLTLLLPPINMAGKDQQGFETLAIKRTSYGLLPRTGARMTYEVIQLRGTAYAAPDHTQDTSSGASA